jgi:hypothetical protein
MCHHHPLLFRQNGVYPLPMPRLVRQMGAIKIDDMKKRLIQKLLSFAKRVRNAEKDQYNGKVKVYEVTP